MACNSKVQMACIYSILTGVKATEQAPPPQACVLLVTSCAHTASGVCKRCRGLPWGSPQDGNSLLRLVLHGPGSGAEWRLLVGGKRQVLAAVRPTSHCSAMGDGGITHRQMEWPATVLA